MKNDLNYDFRVYEEKFPIDKINPKYSLWPVVYILRNQEYAYIGETNDVLKRIQDHNKDPQKKVYRFDKVSVIFSEEFNKSAVYDIESKLIKYIHADEKYKKIANKKMEQRNFLYYQKNLYLQKYFKKIWTELLNRKIVKNTMQDIENKSIFKYSPFTEFSNKQYEVIQGVINGVAEDTGETYENIFGENVSVKRVVEKEFGGHIVVVEGGPGTGKTLVAIKLLFDLLNEHKVEGEIGLCVPQKSVLRNVKKIIKDLKIKNVSVLSPVDLHRNKFDILIVDEAHRLRKWFSKQANALNHLVVDKKQGVYTNELNQAFSAARHTILLYDEKQKVRPVDVDFMKEISQRNYEYYKLEEQFRVRAGNDYIHFIESLLQIKGTPVRKMDFGEYDFELVDSIQELHEKIVEKENTYGLSRMGSGYYVEWISKGKGAQPIYDFHNEGYDIKWNVKYENWIFSENAINEVGCIYTLQGHDLNYMGVIIGDDIKYDKANGRIYADYKNSYDRNAIPVQGKENIEEEFLQYIKHVYYVLLTRGILGTYIYVKNPELREYIKSVI